MIRHADEVKTDYRENVRGGNGTVIQRNILNDAAEMNGKGRTYAHMILEPGCSIGFHVHQGDSECYYVIKGEGEYNENNERTVTLHAGDATITPDGCGHAIKNIGNENLEFIALILYS